MGSGGAGGIGSVAAGAINKVGDIYTELPSEQALANLGQLALADGSAKLTLKEFHPRGACIAAGQPLQEGIDV